MALDLRAQALSLLLALALGAGLGLLYDLLRPLRRRGGTALWDLVFCLCAALLSFVFAMRADSGVLGTGELLLSLFGLLLYLRFFSALQRPLIDALAEKIGALWLNTQNISKKVSLYAKKLFQNRHG